MFRRLLHEPDGNSQEEQRDGEIRIVEAPFVQDRFSTVHQGDVLIDPKKFDHKRISIHTANKADATYKFVESSILMQDEDAPSKIAARNERMQVSGKWNHIETLAGGGGSRIAGARAGIRFAIY